MQLLWREEGLRVPQHAPKRRRIGDSTVLAQRLRGRRLNQVRALNFDATSDGRSIKADDVVKLTVRGWLKPHNDWWSISKDIHRPG